MSTSDFKKKRELDEARKNGTLPPEQDADGNLINPHNPEYISKRPWYLGDSGPSLKHQTLQNQSHLLSIHEADDLYLRGRKAHAGSTPDRPRKWRKGACKNCGAMSHKTLECVERPRKVGAWKTNKDLKSDDVVVDVRSQQFGKLAFDAKRDQWLGYDPKEHARTIDRYEKVDAARKKLRTEETTVRNLRIREDTAKYLRNLNPNSAYYDPKTRSMRDNPNPELNPEDTTFMGDNIARFTGDAQKLASAQLFAWEAYAKGTGIHPQANPSQAEFLKQQYEERKAALEKEKSRKILDKYGGQQHLEAPPKELLLAQSEHYVEYARDGRVVKGLERAPVRSKYVEDALENNHTSIWGSWFDRGEMAWGYACCHSKVRKSYCTGADGKKALEAAKTAGTERAMLKPPEKLETGQADGSAAAAAGGVISKRSEMYGENIAPELDERKLKKAMKKAAKEKKRQSETDDKKRKYNSMGNYEVNAEEMEAYKLLKTRGDDPMARVLGSDDVLPEEGEGEGKGKRGAR
ncbi:hypothetical protein BBJ28_00002043 [Nothophytophthora sp. Chile5]|nr:hypothetical protein BBJ28_00002043 [Nothophytophthora sp. Chile5]